MVNSFSSFNSVPTLNNLPNTIKAMPINKIVKLKSMRGLIVRLTKPGWLNSGLIQIRDKLCARIKSETVTKNTWAIKAIPINSIYL